MTQNIKLINDAVYMQIIIDTMQISVAEYANQRRSIGKWNKNNDAENANLRRRIFKTMTRYMQYDEMQIDNADYAKKWHRYKKDWNISELRAIVITYLYNITFSLATSRRKTNNIPVENFHR